MAHSPILSTAYAVHSIYLASPILTDLSNKTIYSMKTSLILPRSSQFPSLDSHSTLWTILAFCFA